MGTEEALKSALEEAQKIIEEQDAVLKTLTKPPLESAIVIDIKEQKAFGKKLVTISLHGEELDVYEPNNVKLKPGDVVFIQPKTRQIIGKKDTNANGIVAYVNEVVKDKAIVEINGSERTVLLGSNQVEEGDRVVVSNDIVVVDILPAEKKFDVKEKLNIDWNDIKGLEEAKAKLKEAIEYPHKFKDVYKKYGKRQAKGVLLYGAPGCGKTMLAKAAATSLAKIYQKDSVDTFIYIKGPEILSKYVGVAEATIRNIFERAKAHMKEHGFPSIVFIDEAESLLSKRGHGVSQDTERTIVPQFLSEMDGLEDSGAFVILATNRSDILDPAIIRDGRIDRKIQIQRPNELSAKEILLSAFKSKPVSADPALLAETGIKEIYSNDRRLYEIWTKGNSVYNFHLKNLINGAMIAGIAENSISIALQRDIQNGGKSISGIRQEDVVKAVNVIERDNYHINHTDELKEFTETLSDEVEKVNKIERRFE